MLQNIKLVMVAETHNMFRFEETERIKERQTVRNIYVAKPKLAQLGNPTHIKLTIDRDDPPPA